jgi:rhamnogalacturonyl hydrolase YesR
MLHALTLAFIVRQGESFGLNSLLSRAPGQDLPGPTAERRASDVKGWSNILKITVLAWISFGCAGSQAAGEQHSLRVDVIGDKVADWQLSKLGALDYFRTEHPGQRDPRAWHHGAFYVGLMTWADLPGNEKYSDALKKIGADNGWQLGRRLFHADDHVVGQLYLHLYEKERDPGMIVHLVEHFNQILVADPDGSLEFSGDHIRGVGRACQLRWCWCDALFMSPPAWIKLSLLTGDERYMDFGDKEFWATHDYLLDPEYSLFYRDSRFFTRRDEQGNKIFWSRGNGWVYAGLVNILRMLPQDHPSYARYVDLYLSMSATIVDVQRDNGLWSVSLLSANAYPVPETSGSAFMVYGLAWGLNQGHLDSDTYGTAVRKGWSALVDAVEDDGKLGWVQPVGSAPDSVLASDSHLYGVGAFLLAASQVIELREE